MEYLWLILYAWLLADFMSGIFHWVEDKFLNKKSNYKFLENIRLDNDLHHSKPWAMLKFTWWQNINTTAYFTIPASILLWSIGAPGVVSLAVFFATFGNLVHRWAHEPKKHLPRLIRWMQSTGFFIDLEHHHQHHFANKKMVPKHKTTLRYCPMTNLLNPLLDEIGFWKFLEKFIKPNY